ncbi:MAG: hypothetical protein WC223_10860 [Bacteroidales bacterium]|jgi:hypothetical protein
MKTTNLLISALAILFVFAGCTTINFKPQTNAVSVVVDLTDQFIAKPKPDEILSFLNSGKNIWDGRIFNLRYITNVSYNPMFEKKIEEQNELLGNRYDRPKKVKQYNDEVKEIIISSATKEDIGRDNSEVWFSIATELNQLSQSGADKKVLLVYSDLMENSKRMSFYANDTWNLLKSNPIEIKEYFDSLVKLGDLKGVMVYFIYQPKNTTDDENFRIASQLYKSMLEAKGATVHISANIN